jgi:hypothetical protein
MYTCIEAVHPPRVLKDVTRVATKMHNTMRKQEDVHWEVTTYRLSMDMPLLQEHLCLFIVCILLVAAGRVRWKLQTLVHGEDGRAK